MSKKAAKKSPKAPIDRSAAISESWKDAKVAKARTTRNEVKVGKTVYSSTRAAFTALKLPAGRCIAFRGKLKAAGSLAFEDDSGKKYNFKIVAAE